MTPFERHIEKSRLSEELLKAIQVKKVYEMELAKIEGHIKTIELKINELNQ